MDAATPQPGELTLSLPTALPEAEARVADVIRFPAPAMAEEFWLAAEAEACGLTREDFAQVLAMVGERHNYNLPPGAIASAPQQAMFYRGLRLADLALAQACALGHESAWQRFIAMYRTPLTQAAVAITGSATLGHDLADSLYAELYGVGRGAESAVRRSPLGSYSGRGSLMGWLRTTLAQRHVDHHRRTRREAPLEELDHTEGAAAAVSEPVPQPAELARLSSALARTLVELEAEDRFLLSSYFLDQKTLLQIGRLMQVHEATISRRLKRLTGDLRKQLLRNLESGDPPRVAALSRRAAEEALGADPRDLNFSGGELNLRALLQTSLNSAFPEKEPLKRPPQSEPAPESSTR